MSASRSTKGAAIALAVMIAAGWAQGLWAQTEEVALSYDADAACPDARQFMGQVRARTSRASFVSHGAPRTFLVRIRPTQGGFAGHLSVTDAQGRASDRHFEEKTCDEVVGALALVTALAVDPKAAVGPITSSAPSASEPLPVAAPSAVASVAPAPVPLPAFAPEPPAMPSPSPWAGSVGLRLGMVTGPATKVLAAGGLMVQAEDRSAGVWTSLFRLSVMAARTGLVGAKDEQARFGWYAVRMQWSPARLDLGSGWDVRPCAMLDLGAITAQAEQVSRSLEATSLWSAAGIGGLVRWSSGQWFVDVDGALFSPLRRDRFVLLPERELVHELPSVGGSVLLSVGGIIL